jgi:hypothetical protein
VRTADEIGREGLEQWHGQVTETYLPKLQWPGAYTIYDEMRRRDPTLRSILNAVRLLGRQASWTVERRGDGLADEAADHVARNLETMSHTVDDLIDDALTMLPFGWASSELVYERRDDGRIYWKKIAPRRQSSLARWEFDDAGGMQGWWQRAAPDYEDVFLPVHKLLHFVAERDGTNPEGLPLFESAYEPWYFVKNLQIISGIGWQRSFVGLPVFEFEDTPSDTDKALVKSISAGLQVGSQQYVSVPPKISFRLETVANTNADSLLNTIRMYRVMMTQMVLADFIWLGTSGSAGSWSLGSDKSTLFLMGVNGYLDRIAEVWTQYGVSRLLDANPAFAGLPQDQRPAIVHSDVRKFKLTELGSFVQQIAQYIPLYDSDAVWLREQAGLPEASGERLTPRQGQEGEGAVWRYPDDREPVGAASEFRGDEIELAEVDYQHEEERREMEDGLAGVVGEFLDAQLDRVLKAASAALNVGADDAFWEAEVEAMREVLLRDVLRTVLALAEMAVEDVEEDFVGGADWALVNARAAAWAREYVGDLIRQVTETTREATRETIATWIETGGTLDDLVETLAPTYGPQRAELIATTEVTRAFDEANDLVRQRVGLPAADVKAPAHPRCRCYTRPVFVDGEWLIVWNTVRDELVCKQPLSMPWGRVAGCREMHTRVVGGPSGLIGKTLSEARRALGD